MEKYFFDEAKLPKPILKERQDLVDLYYQTWKLAFQNVEYLKKDNWKPQLTCMPGVGVTWQWDACIMTFITNYSNGTLSAFNNLDNLYRLRRKSDGYMSMAYKIESEEPAYGERINPPLMAFAEWEHYLVLGDFSRFEKVLPMLESLYNFIEKNRTRNCGLYYFEDSGSSGMDNSPRSGYFSEYLNGSDVCFVDLACQQALSAKCIGLMNDKLGNSEKAKFYADENKRICDLINKFHWCEKSGFYYDLFARSKANEKLKFINTKTGAAFWTLLCGAAQGYRAEKMKSHLFNESEFYTKVPFPSLSKDDLNYDEKGGYWLGGVWAPTNFVAIRGLSNLGYKELAKESAVKYLEAILNVYNNFDCKSIWEMYSPEEFAPGTTENGELCRKDFVGWSGIGPITLLIENIIGLRFNADENKVSFYVSYSNSGIDNMNFNGAYLNIKCTNLSAIENLSVIEVDCEKPFVLEVSSPYLKISKKINIEKGFNSIKF